MYPDSTLNEIQGILVERHKEPELFTGDWKKLTTLREQIEAWAQEVESSNSTMLEIKSFETKSGHTEAIELDHFQGALPPITKGNQMEDAKLIYTVSWNTDSRKGHYSWVDKEFDDPEKATEHARKLHEDGEKDIQCRQFAAIYLREDGKWVRW